MTEKTFRPNNRNQQPAEQSPEGELPVDAEEAEMQVDGAQDAVTEMVAHERRRDQTYRTGGDDLDPGINEQIDDNAPKELELPLRKRSENQT